MKILVVDDEREFVEVLAAAFEIYRPGYTVVAAHTGIDALATAEMTDPDLAVLDVMLPDIDGLEVCRRLRASREIPVLLLSAKADKDDVARGIEAGAEDYITKPFKYPALMARIDELLFRAKAMPDSERPGVLRCGDLIINFGQGEVKLRGKQIDLTAQEYRILEELARSPGRVISHETLLARVWGPEYRYDPQYLRTYVYRLRQKIEADPQHPRYILTHHGEGYRLAAEEIDDQEPAKAQTRWHRAKWRWA